SFSRDWSSDVCSSDLSASLAIPGTAARTRPSSVIRSPSSGTFRSARTSTVRPDTPSFSRSSSVFSTVARPSVELRTDQLDQVGEPVGVAPLVVVPADHLDLVADDLGQ